MVNEVFPKVALITGAARRIGAKMAQILHQSGMNIILHYHKSHATVLQLEQELNTKRSNSAIAINADLTNMVNIVSLIAKAFKAWNRLDVLINNASQFHKTYIGETSENSWDILLNSNLKAPFFLSQAASPYLKKTNGCIINIGDIHAKRPMRDYAVYCISKAGLLMLTKSLAKELGKEIRVNMVSPGTILWPENSNSLADDIKHKIIERTALKREGDPNDIAKAVLYFIRDAEYVTGQILEVDGGRVLSI